MSLIIEGKFPREYLYDENEVFYHETDRKFLDKILKIGLVPKSRFNYLEKIYLTTDIEDLDNMELKNDDITILKIQLKNKQKLYFDPRSNILFTYDNISPDEILEIL